MIETIIPLHLLHQLLLLQGCQTQGNSSIRYKLLSARSEFIVRSVIYEEKLIIFLRRHQASPCPRFYRYSWMTSVSSACALIWATFKVADLYFFRHSSEQLVLQFMYCSAELLLHTFSSERWKCLQSTFLAEIFSQDNVCKGVFSFYSLQWEHYLPMLNSSFLIARHRLQHLPWIQL